MTLFESNSLARVLVVGTEPSRVCTPGYFTTGGCFGQSVDSFAIGILSVHEMHLEIFTDSAHLTPVALNVAWWRYGVHRWVVLELDSRGF